MKKAYMTPNTVSIKIRCATMIAGSLNDNNGMRMDINNSNATKEAGSRQADFWDDEE